MTGLRVMAKGVSFWENDNEHLLKLIAISDCEYTKSPCIIHSE